MRNELTNLGIPFVVTGETGTIGIVRGQNDFPVIALRADIDALEITEQNDIAYKSQNEGIMHACGHDAHTAALLTAAKILNKYKSEIKGSVKLIFQPAEEYGQGAQTVIASGELNDVNAFFGIHVKAGLDVGKVALQKGAIMGGANSLNITVTGKSGHGGHPDEAIDAIVAGAEIVEALQHIVSREIPPTEPAVVSVCQFHAGTRNNIIAKEAHISGTVRIASEKTRLQISEAVERIASGIGSAHRVKTEVDCTYATPILINSNELYEIVANATESVLSKEAIVSFTPQLGTEDFSRYGEIAPIFFTFIGSGGCFPHHHERFDIDEKVLPIAVALYSSFVFEFFDKL